MKIWLTADWHLGDPRIQLMDRPFLDEYDAFNHILTEFNKVVAPEDLVYVVGDVVYKNADDPTRWLRCTKLFNGRKRLCRGNHDRIFTDEELSPYFEEIKAEPDGFIEVYEDRSYFITHYPTQGRMNAFNLVGHIHTAWKYQLNAMNVGVDANHYRPVALDSLPRRIQAIETVYDEDVWSAYHPSNTAFRDERGTKSRYLDK